MTGLDGFRGRRVGILGLARSGLALARALRAAGAEVVGFDDRPEALAASGLEAGHPARVGELALLVPSPGVPPAHPLFAAAQALGVTLRGDIDLFAEAAAPRPIVGITGTNGKSTTTALIAHLLATAGHDAVAGGNIGRAAFDLDPGPPDRTIVLELSSFQLDLCQHLRCRVAVWLNFSPDHLDRHGTVAGYRAAKERIFRNQGRDDLAVVGIDDPESDAVAQALEGAGRRVIPVSLERQPAGGVAVAGSRLLDLTAGRTDEICDLAALPALRGRHNWQNAAVAFATLRALGVPPERAAAGLAGFRGLAHRMETVARDGTVLYVNDSKATNPDAARHALGAYPAIWWIAGGKPKPGGFASLRPHLGRVREGFLIGAAAAEIRDQLGDLVPLREVGTLDEAVRAAGAAARRSGEPEAVVLLAPACASFDQFTDFEARGDAFRRLASATVAAGAGAMA